MTNELQIQIDRFIDNELDAEAASRLLQHCDEAPDAWRQLALRLVEAREVQHALRDLVRPPVVTQSVRPNKRVKAIVAPLLLASIAFLIGWFSPTWVPELSTSDVKRMAVRESVESEEPGRQQVVSADSNKLAVVGYARVLNDAGTNTSVPVIAGRGLDHEKLLRQSPRVPDHIQRRYRNQGLSVSAKRSVVSLELADGQRLAIPLDEFDVRFIGNNVL
ncbi:MAG: hypothetical protein AB8G99_16305 [Planctomycetaceae bacterium]